MLLSYSKHVAINVCVQLRLLLLKALTLCGCTEDHSNTSSTVVTSAQMMVILWPQCVQCSNTTVMGSGVS